MSKTNPEQKPTDGAISWKEYGEKARAELAELGDLYKDHHLWTDPRFLELPTPVEEGSEEPPSE